MTDPSQPDRPSIQGRNRRRKGLSAFIQRLGWPLVENIFYLGGFARFCWMVAKRVPASLMRPHLIWIQMYHLGTRSMPIIVVSGLFIGLVLGLQFHTILDRYGQTQVVGAAAAIALFRELGPVLAGLLFIGCSCTAVTAAIGLKRSSEQLAAMEVMAVDPLEREIAPRFIAGSLCLPLLTIILLAVAIVGTYAIVVLRIGMDEGFFWGNMQRFTKFFGDFTEGMLKSAVFGLTSSIIALYHGYNARPTAEGVAHATTSTVVYASLTLLGLDFVLTSMLAR